jgi:pilus assembly protein CpaF
MDGGHRAFVTGVHGLKHVEGFLAAALAEDGTIHGHYQATGIRPKFLTELAARGLSVPSTYFDPTKHL